MKVLGRGWQYSVYDLGNGRVLKRQNAPLVQIGVMLRDAFPYFYDPLWTFPKMYRECRQLALLSIRKIEFLKEIWPMLGNPRVISPNSYEQDRATPLSTYFFTMSQAEGEKMIDAFVAFNKTLVQHSVMERSFDIATNFGINASGEMVLIDLGELYVGKEQIDPQIRSRIWAKQYVLKRLPRNLRTYFVEKMDEGFLPLNR